jgi:hypothetical protein
VDWIALTKTLHTNPHQNHFQLCSKLVSPGILILEFVCHGWICCSVSLLWLILFLL